MMASVSLILARNLFPRPSPLLAPFTRPAISTISTVVGITLSGFTRLSSFSSLASGTFTTPILGSMVQKGKFADCALAFDRQLNKVDFPTFGSPTIPAFILLFFWIANIGEYYCFFDQPDRIILHCCLPENFHKKRL